MHVSRKYKKHACLLVIFCMRRYNVINKRIYMVKLKLANIIIKFNHQNPICWSHKWGA